MPVGVKYRRITHAAPSVMISQPLGFPGQETSINEKRLILLRSFPSEVRVCWRGPEEEVPSQPEEGLADPLVNVGVDLRGSGTHKRGYSSISGVAVRLYTKVSAPPSI